MQISRIGSINFCNNVQRKRFTNDEMEQYRKYIYYLNLGKVKQNSLPMLAIAIDRMYNQVNVGLTNDFNRYVELNSEKRVLYTTQNVMMKLKKNKMIFTNIPSVRENVREMIENSDENKFGTLNEDYNFANIVNYIKNENDKFLSDKNVRSDIKTIKILEMLMQDEISKRILLYG